MPCSEHALCGWNPPKLTQLIYRHRTSLQLVSEELALLGQSYEQVGGGTLLSIAFPDEEDDDRSSWASPDGAPLSLKQIVWLADLGKVNPEFSLKYADGIRLHSVPPKLVTERIRDRERKLIREK